MTILEAIEEFRAAAIAKADFAAPASRDHALHRRMADAFEYLASQGSEGHTAFFAMLHDESPHVRDWVAAQLLSQDDEAAVPVMEQLAAEPGIRGFTAETTLKEFRAGRLRSPFTTRDT
jgi:hypothetical protein